MLSFDSETNPNHATGGGCIGCELQCGDCKGPFRIFPGREMEGFVAPHVVLPYSVAKEFVEAVEAGGEVLKAGESGPVVDADAELIETVVEAPRPPRHENPVAEGGYPTLSDLDEDLPI